MYYLDIIQNIDKCDDISTSLKGKLVFHICNIQNGSYSSQIELEELSKDLPENIKNQCLNFIYP